jgi:hypothetical protein
MTPFPPPVPRKRLGRGTASVCYVALWRIRSDTRRLSAGPGREKGDTRPRAVCSKGEEGSPGGPAEVLNSYQPGTH